MITAQVKYLGDLRTEAVHVKSGQRIVTDAPVDNHGKGEAFSPTDLTSTSLACCMMTIMGIAARTHQIILEGARAEVVKHMANDPRRISRIEISFFMPERDYSSTEKTILEKAAKGCPVCRSISEGVEVTLQFHWPR